MYSRVVLLKDSGVSQGFNTIADAMAAADANDLILAYPGSHAVASALTAKSNVTIQVLPGATVTFAEEISLGAGITNFKIVGEGNVVFTGNAFEPAGVYGAGNGIFIGGDLTIGLLAVYQNGNYAQAAPVTLEARNVSITGDIVGQDSQPGVASMESGDSLIVVIVARSVLTVPVMCLAPSLSGASLTLIADSIVCTASSFAHYAGSLNVRARIVNIGNNYLFSDPAANQSLISLEVDELLFNKAGQGINSNGTLVSLVFKKHVRIKQSATANDSHVIDVSDGSSGLRFLEGAVLHTNGGTGSLAIKGSGAIVANRDVLSNKGFDSITSAGGGALVTNAGIAL